MTHITEVNKANSSIIYHIDEES